MACLCIGACSYRSVMNFPSTPSRRKRRMQRALRQQRSAQVLVVYVYAGISKLQLIGSMDPPTCTVVHDHGTWVGELLNTAKAATKFLTLSTLFLEIGGPFLFFVGNHFVRRSIALIFILFHVGIWITLTLECFRLLASPHG